MACSKQLVQVQGVLLHMQHLARTNMVQHLLRSHCWATSREG